MYSKWQLLIPITFRWYPHVCWWSHHFAAEVTSLPLSPLYYHHIPIFWWNPNSFPGLGSQESAQRFCSSRLVTCGCPKQRGRVRSAAAAHCPTDDDAWTEAQVLRPKTGSLGIILIDIVWTIYAKYEPCIMNDDEIRLVKIVIIKTIIIQMLVTSSDNNSNNINSKNNDNDNYSNPFCLQLCTVWPLALPMRAYTAHPTCLNFCHHRPHIVP